MKTEKLQLKHLSPYLPYGLLMFDDDNPNQYYPRLIGVLNDENIITSLPRFPYNYNCGISTFKPILRPLSDLTPGDSKEFEYVSLDDLIRGIESEHCSIKCWNSLLREHFDVFGLIDKGLAVDINTIGGANE